MGLRPPGRGQALRLTGPTTVDYRKLDAGLAIALEEASDTNSPVLCVFVELASDPGTRGWELLAALGARGEETGPLTATVSCRQVKDLSEQPWVGFLRLSRTLGLA